MIIIDTHIWIWLVSDPEKLSEKAVSAIEYSKIIGICPISCWEISTKVTNGKLSLDRNIDVWIQQALARPRIKLIDMSSEIAVLAGKLGNEGLHGDPADRLIVATAIHHGADLVSKDRAIRSFPKVHSIW
jgi:PIN domain nuclease of toxin-antitoxin system